MEYIYDAPFSDVFRCDGELEFHDYHFVSPFETVEPSYLYRVHRTGIERVLPRLFEVERSANTRYCEIFCILSGQGSLTYGGRTYPLHRNQLVLLPAREAHQYKSSPEDPMGTVWLEFYGANAETLIRHLVDLHGPVQEGTLFCRRLRPALPDTAAPDGQRLLSTLAGDIPRTADNAAAQ